jgi:hypothetical protein
VAACIFYLGNFHPEKLPAGIRLPDSFIQKASDHRSVGGTPLGLIFGAISLGIFVFAALLGMRKRLRVWRMGHVQTWLRAHIWLTLLTIPLVILHSGFRLGGPMTIVLMVLYAIVMVSGIYGLALQHRIPTLMKEQLPAEAVYQQIPHIGRQLVAAAEQLRDALKPRAVRPEATPRILKSITGNLPIPGSPERAPTAMPAVNPAGAPAKAPQIVATPIVHVREGMSEMSPGTNATAAGVVSNPAAVNSAVVTDADIPEGSAADPASEAFLVNFIESEILPYLSAGRGDKMRLGNARYSDDTFTFTKLRVAEPYRARVDQIQNWCDERRMLDLQTKMQHWLHGWLFVHVPISFLLLIMTVWHAFVTLFYY